MSLSWDELDHLRPKHEWRLPIPPTCRRCDYNLTGLPEDRCPECGTPFRWREVRNRAARIWTLTLRLKHANQDAMAGLVMGLGGGFLFGLGKVLGSGFFEGLMRVLAWTAAVLAIILGAQVLNLRRVPPFARVHIGEPAPSVLLGAAAMLVGLALLIGALLL